MIKEQLKKAINDNLSYILYKDEEEEISLPLLEFSPVAFDALYGSSPNIYLKAYFSYLFKKGKPVYSENS